MKRTYYIYILRNPKNQEIFYVGCTMNPEQRLIAHCIYNPTGRNKTDVRPEYLCRRERYILENQIVPIMEIIDLIEGEGVGKRAPSAAIRLERKWVEELKANGHKLTNRTKVVPEPIKYSIGQTITL